MSLVFFDGQTVFFGCAVVAHLTYSTDVLYVMPTISFARTADPLVSVRVAFTTLSVFAITEHCITSPPMVRVCVRVYV